MKKKLRSLLALVMALAMILALTACGSSSTDTDTVEDTDEEETSIVSEEEVSVADEGDTSADYEEEPLYIEVSVGDVLYSDDNCSVTLASLETNENGGSTLTLSLDSNYESSLAIDVSAYHADMFNAFLKKDAAGKDVSIQSEEDLSEVMVDDGSEENQIEIPFAFSGEYVYFHIAVDVYSEVITKELYDSDEYLHMDCDTLYIGTILVNTAE